MENEPGNVNMEKWAAMVPGEVIASGEVMTEGVESAPNLAPEGVPEAAKAELGREAVRQVAEVLRPVDAVLEGSEGLPGGALEGIETGLGTTGVNGEDVIEDGKTEAVGTDNPEKFRQATVIKFIKREEGIQAQVEKGDFKGAADAQEVAAEEYKVVMFGRHRGDGITGQKGGLAG